jgi:tRNA (guanine37-N1)-methyltransferase
MADSSLPHCRGSSRHEILHVMRFDILTLFPEMFSAVLGASILGRAREAGLVSYHAHDIRAFTEDKHNRVDDRPFGGGPGMVMMCQPVFDCVRAVEAMAPAPEAATRILLTPQGERLTQQRVEWLVTKHRLLLIAGHYEGLDERVIDELQPLELSVGDFVMSGGEIPAMALIDAVVRLLPGALGDEASAGEDTFTARQIGPAGMIRRLLEGPHYTRPRNWNGRDVPEILLSGNHEEIAKWRFEQMMARTERRRPDLLQSPASPAMGTDEMNAD